MNHKVLIGIGASLLIVAVTVLLVIQIIDTRKIRESLKSDGVSNTTAPEGVVHVSTIYGGFGQEAVIGVPTQCKENEVFVARRRKCERVY